MATPTVAEKRLLAAGAAKGSAWGTAVAVGAGDGALIESDGGIKQSRDHILLAESDSPFPACGSLGPNNPVDFSPSGFQRYEPTALGTLIAQLFGTAGSPVLQSTTLAYLHQFQIADHISGQFSTFVIERPNKIFEIPSAKPYGAVWNFADGHLKFTLNLRGNLVKDNSTTNQATQVDALTYDSKCLPARFNEMAVRMNDESGGDLSGESDLANVSDVNIEFTRTLDGVVAAGADEIIEPLESGMPTMKVTLNFARMDADNDDFFQEFDAQTLKKLYVKFTGPLIEETYYYQLIFWFPRLRISDVEYPHDDIIPARLELTAEEATAAPTGMDYARPYIDLQNEKTTDYLA